MKLNINRSIMWFARTLVILSLIVVTACEQDYKLELPLSVTQNSLNIDPSGSQIHVLVYATGGWEAAFVETTPWASILKSSGEGNGEFIFKCEINPGIVRKTDIVIRSGDREQTVTMIQNGFITEAEVALKKTTLQLPTWNSEIGVGLITNMGLALERFSSKIAYFDADGTEMVEAQPWVSDLRILEDSLYFVVSANETTKPRTAQLTLEVVDHVNNKVYSSAMHITQGTEAGFMRFGQELLDVESFEKMNTAAWTTNLEAFFEVIKSEVVYGAGAGGWISNVAYATDAVSFDVAENTTSGIREATLTLTYRDQLGHETSASQKIVQARPALAIDYADLRARLSSTGSTKLEQDYILGVVIGDMGNPNMEVNPHTSWVAVDYSVNQKTTYIQSLDGEYGFRIQTATEADNVLVRYSTVKIALAGLTLIREDNPMRYTLSNFVADNLLETIPGTASMLVHKERYVADLTDADLYTFVSLKEVEFAFDHGAYGNIHEGYTLKSDIIPGGNVTATRCDCMPRVLRDIQGGTINLLFNSQVPWRRTSRNVPKGAGTASGIVVHSTVPRYGDDRGRYQLRPLEEADLAIQASETDGFSTKIAEWVWPTSTILLADGSTSRVLPASGVGYMDTSAALTGTKTARTANFIGLTFASYSSGSAFRYNAKWWNFTKDEGESIYWNFSTSGISGANRHLTLVFTAGTGNQSATKLSVPTYWDLSYSVDGTVFTQIKQLLIYPAPVFAYEQMDCPAGLPEYVVALPDVLLGQPNVTVKIQAVSKTCPSMEGVDQGVIKSSDAALYFRFDGISIKYNK